MKTRLRFRHPALNPGVITLIFSSALSLPLSLSLTRPPPRSRSSWSEEEKTSLPAWRCKNNPGARIQVIGNEIRKQTEQITWRKRLSSSSVLHLKPSLNKTPSSHRLLQMCGKKLMNGHRCVWYFNNSRISDLRWVKDGLWLYLLVFISALLNNGNSGEHIPSSVNQYVIHAASLIGCSEQQSY